MVDDERSYHMSHKPGRRNNANINTEEQEVRYHKQLAYVSHVPHKPDRCCANTNMNNIQQDNV